jgi:hypothetical protein
MIPTELYHPLALWNTTRNIRFSESWSGLKSEITFSREARGRTARSRALLRCRKRSIYSSRKTNSFFRALLSEPLFPALSNGALGTLLLKFSFRRREPE